MQNSCREKLQVPRDFFAVKTDQSGGRSSGRLFRVRRTASLAVAATVRDRRNWADGSSDPNCENPPTRRADTRLFCKKIRDKTKQKLRSDASGKTFCPVFVIGVTFYRPDYARAGPWIYLIQKIRTTNSHICLLN